MKLKIIVWILSAVVLSAFGQLENVSATTTSSVVISNVYFAELSVELSLRSKQNLNSLLKFLREHPQTKWQLIGHKDLEECKKERRPLAVRRALVVKKYLVENGIEAERLRTLGAGCNSIMVKSKNPDGSDNLAGQQLNRRVEFKLLKS